MKNILALALFVSSSAAMARPSLCEARLENTFSRTQVGQLTIKAAGPKTFSQLRKTNGTTLTSSSATKEKTLNKNSFNFDNFVIQMKDNNLNINGVKSLKLRKIDFGTLDLNFVTTKNNKFVSSNDGFIFGVCK